MFGMNLDKTTLIFVGSHLERLVSVEGQRDKEASVSQYHSFAQRHGILGMVMVYVE
jgi:hypothetical protein